ncbi:MAG: CoA transferase [Dehalococcoidia bacterium]|nr:MAG: CoA transferase [Dehalococcoidia bacterium]
MTRMALEGLRILDVTHVWAGPMCTRLLGDMGADVIKVESARRTDTGRGEANPRGGPGSTYPDGIPGERPWNRAAHVNERNRSKRDICLDLTHPRGIEAFKRLVANCDVVVESFRSGVMARFGLGYRDLVKVKPDIIMVSLSSQGSTGPESSYGSFGATLEQTAGLASVTGYLGGDPTTSGTFFPDPVVAVMSVGLILAAVRQRQTTGRGTYVDLSQREATTSIIGEAIMDYTMNGRAMGPIGNRDRVFAPQGIYPCTGDDMWIVISVRSDAEWAALANVIGQPGLAEDARFADVVARRAHHDDADAIIGAWTATRDAFAVMAALQAVHVPAGVAEQGAHLLEDPHLNARGFWETVTHPEAGTAPFLSRPFQFSKTPGATRRHAPLLGEHTEEVLREVGGMSDAEIAELAALGITENNPRAVVASPD